MDVLQLVDPEGVARRQRNVLRRRVYHNKGPNYLIHIDGFDKLKPYGFAIHGAICGLVPRFTPHKKTIRRQNGNATPTLNPTLKKAFRIDLLL